MEFIKIAYCVTVPLLLFCAWLRSWRKWAINTLAVTNLLLIGNSVFLVKQLWGFYRLAQYFPAPPGTDLNPDIVASIHLLSVILLPFFSLIARLRRNQWFSLLVFLVLYKFYPLSTWNFFDLATKIPQYFCLLCASYALLWLFNRLPYQSSPN
jgi:hypothetical protein